MKGKWERRLGGGRLLLWCLICSGGYCYGAWYLGKGGEIYLCCPTRDSRPLRDWVNAGTASRVEAERAGSASRVRLVVISYSPHWR